MGSFEFVPFFYASPFRYKKEILFESKLFQVDANKKYTCILCQEDREQNDTSSTLVYATYIVNSTVLSQVHPIDPNMTGKFVSQVTIFRLLNLS